MELKYIVKNDKYQKINQVLKNEFQISSRLLIKLIKNKKIFLNNTITDTRTPIKENDEIRVLLDLKEDNSNIVPTKIDLKIAFEDEGLLVINKPAGISIHPSMMHYTDTLSNGVRYYFDRIGLKKKNRPVNRLDKDTSGLVVFAKNEYVQECLIKQMKENTFRKEYLCIVSGIIQNKSGTIDKPIKRKNNSIIERCVSADGQRSITHYEVIKEFENYSLVKCILETGRTHQIRVHMAYIGHPLLGDTLYGKESELIKRQALHCSKLTFINPKTKNKQIINCPLPKDFEVINHLTHLSIKKE